MDLDPTPPDWLGVETEGLASAWERIAEVLRRASYCWEQREELQVADAWWGMLAVILAWRLSRGKRLVRGASAVTARKFPGGFEVLRASEGAAAARGGGDAYGMVRAGGAGEV